MSSPAKGEDPNPNPSSARLHYWGSTPTEDEYYASHGVRGTQTHFTSPRGITLFARSWEPLSSPPRGVVCMVHGYGNDVSWTFQATPIHLASRGGFACFAPDLEGHGQSSGLRAFVPDVTAATSDVAAYFRHALSSRPDLQGLPRFLYGESMGGAICLLLHLQQKDNSGAEGDDGSDVPWSGAVLVAPMCKIADSLRPPWPLPQLLILAARFAPTLPCVPTADLLDKSVKVPEKRAVAGMNPRRYAGKPRLGTVMELLRVTDCLHERLREVELPFLVVHGSADAVTDPAVSTELHEVAGSKDKTIRIYHGMMHSLLFGETDDNVELVLGDILAWLERRRSAWTAVVGE